MKEEFKFLVISICLLGRFRKKSFHVLQPRKEMVRSCLMSGTDQCLNLYFSQHLLLSKTYTLPQKAGKYNPVIFQMGEQKRLQKIVSDSAGNKTQGPNHLSDLHKMHSNARENVFSEGVLNSC